MQAAVQPIAAEAIPVRVEPSVVRDDADLRLWRMEGESKRLVVSFTGLGADPALPPPPDWRRLAAVSPRDHMLFVADPGRTWLNREGMIQEIVDAIEAEVDRCGATQVVTLGHSMGGFSALVIPAFTHVDVAVAMSPQLSVDPKVVPTEQRWSKYRDAIQQYHVSNAADHLVSTCQYYVFFCRHRREAAQLNLVPKSDNLILYVMPNTNHNTPQRLKELGTLDSVLAACFAGKKRSLNKLMKKKQNTPKANETDDNASNGSM